MDLPDDILRRILRHADYDNGMVVNRGVVLALTCKRLWGFMLTRQEALARFSFKSIIVSCCPSPQFSSMIGSVMDGTTVLILHCSRSETSVRVSVVDVSDAEAIIANITKIVTWIRATLWLIYIRSIRNTLPQIAFAGTPQLGCSEGQINNINFLRRSLSGYLEFFVIH
jgi:hypothetical protein